MRVDMIETGLLLAQAPVLKGRSRYVVSARVRGNSALSAGYVSVRGTPEEDNFRVLNEQRVYGNNSYTRVTFEFNSGVNTKVLFYAGMWGTGPDAWMQVDEVYLHHCGETLCQGVLQTFLCSNGYSYRGSACGRGQAEAVSKASAPYYCAPYGQPSRMVCSSCD
jgi:hypothetical protein